MCLILMSSLPALIPWLTVLLQLQRGWAAGFYWETEPKPCSTTFSELCKLAQNAGASV